MSKTQPSVFEYLNVVLYLKDYYDWRKSKNPKFSFAMWATELGFKSKSYLRMVLIGRKKVSAAFEKAFSQSTNLSLTETEYFHYLTLHSQALKSSDRQLYAKKLISLLQTTVEQREVEKYFDFLQDPHLPVLQTLLSFHDIIPSVESLSKLTGISQTKIHQALDKLCSLDMAESFTEDKNQLWRSKNNNFKVPNIFGDAAVENFHRHSLKEAAMSFRLPKEIRRFRCLLLPMSDEELKEFYDMVDDFASTLLAKYRSNEYQGRQLFKVNILNYPAVYNPSAQFEEDQDSDLQNSSSRSNADFILSSDKT